MDPFAPEKAFWDLHRALLWGEGGSSEPICANVELHRWDPRRQTLPGIGLYWPLSPLFIGVEGHHLTGARGEASRAWSCSIARLGSGVFWMVFIT